MSDLQNNPISLRSIYKKTFKLYWQKYFKKNINPIGYIVLAYENEYKISEKDKEFDNRFY
jgi:endo-1,4-beta-D-glucanase Y